MDSKLDDRLVAFNAGQPGSAQRFDAVHLDIEPQGADDWSGLDEAARHTRVLQLGDTYVEVRSHLDLSGSAVPVSADLAVWLDKLPPALGGDGSIGWSSASERDAWFVGLGDSLQGISVMAYERNTDTLILDAIAGEEALFPGEVRVGLNAEVGTTWPDIDAMSTMADDLESLGRTVDLHSVALIRAELP